MTTIADAVAQLERIVGREIGVSPWFATDQEMVDLFGRLTDDLDPIHNDPEWAKSGPYGGTIVQGFLILSLLGKLLRESGLENSTADQYYALNYGLDRVRFLSPLRVGARIRNRAVLEEIRPRGDGSYVIRTTNSIEIEGETRPCMVAELLIAFVPR